MHELSAVAAVLGRAATPGDGAGVRLVERMVAVLNTGETEALAGLYSQGYVDHDPLPGQPPGVEGVRVGMESLARLGSDVRFHLEDGFAAGDRIAYRIFGSWTVEPELAFETSLRAPRTYQLSGVGIFRCADGRLVERWGPWVIHGPDDPPSAEDGRP